MTANTFQIVDSIAASPTVLLDLNDEVNYGVADLDLSPPPLRYTTSSSMLADGDRISSSAYANRTIGVTFDHIGASQDALATSWQTLARLIDQDTFWIRYRPTGATGYVFFRCYRSQVPSLQDVNGAIAYRRPALQIPADPAAYGLAEDATFTITNDPTTGTNKMMYAFGAVKGDLETPLVLAQTTGPAVASTPTDGISPDSPFVLASYSLSGGLTHAFLARDLTELTSGTDMGAPVTGAGSRYVGGNYKSCSFATTTMATRLSGTFSTAFTPMPGQYRAFLRVVTASGAGSTTYSFRLGVSDGNSYVYGDTISAALTKGGFDFGALIDLGVFQFPVKSATGAIGLAPPSTTTRAADVSLQASGSVALRFDEIYFIPIETTYGSARLALIDPPLSASVLVYDAVNDNMRGAYDASGTAPLSGIPDPPLGVHGFVGGFPTVIPGRNNYLQFFYENNVVTDTAAFTARYYPRYLHVRPAST